MLIDCSSLDQLEIAAKSLNEFFLGDIISYQLQGCYHSALSVCGFVNSEIRQPTQFQRIVFKYNHHAETSI